MPGRGLADPHLRLGRRVLRLDHFLLCAERLDLGLKRALAFDQLLLLSLELLALLHDPVELGLDGGLPRQRLAGEILVTGLQRLPRLAVELFDLLLHPGVLQLEPLLGGRHVSDAPLDVLELPQLLLVGIVERLVRVLGPVERFRELRLEDQRQTCHQPRHWWFQLLAVGCTVSLTGWTSSTPVSRTTSSA